MCNYNFQSSTKAEIIITVCIDVNGAKVKSCAMTLTFSRQFPMSNSSKLILYTALGVNISSGLIIYELLF